MVDDLVALVVIAIVYTDHVSMLPLLLAVGFFALLVALRYVPFALANARRPLCSALRSGWRCSSPASIRVVAGLAIGLVTSAYPPARDDLERVDRADPVVP